MHRSLIAFVLCIAAQGTLAQCADRTIRQDPLAFAELKYPAGTTYISAPASPRPAPGFISSAAAQTRDDAPIAGPAPPRQAGESEHPRRGGTAMVLAALALMTGIVLRRYGAPGP